MKYTVNDIGTYVQLTKGMRVQARHVFFPLSHLITWEIEASYGVGRLVFDSPALLLAINEDKRTIEVRLPFIESDVTYIVDMDEERALFDAV